VYNLNIDKQFVAIFLIGIIIMVVLVNLIVFWFVFTYMKREYELKINTEKINASYERQMLNLKNETRNTEMKYFARELHDNLGQIASQLKMFVDFTVEHKYLNSTSPGIELVDKLKIEIRRLSSRYNHFSFQEFNLIDSISNDILRISKFSKMMIDLNLPSEEITLDNHRKAEVFRIYQELINNTLTHSNAKNIRISINSNKQCLLEMSIEDDGVGFDSSNMKIGSGLNNMKERTKQMGASLIINSRSGIGTLSTLTLTRSLDEQ
jgi:signal transduction histidine kinase